MKLTRTHYIIIGIIILLVILYFVFKKKPTATSTLTGTGTMATGGSINTFPSSRIGTPCATKGLFHNQWGECVPILSAKDKNSTPPIVPSKSDKHFLPREDNVNNRNVYPIIPVVPQNPECKKIIGLLTDKKNQLTYNKAHGITDNTSLINTINNYTQALHSLGCTGY